ncbi:hypothetical protein OPAG_06569 [Rhodococcus opacus PD630]|uniref:hypothetical protein n=1 Tax=Rhodococcus opacus TaxID=37919 RepID=UPI00029CCA22|nr:hypothetical protein [Rhodococcus opacus]EHI43294.1 hypothetical protein OPAG_06569 [Rhodococcus opacus PD630]UDH01511.1 hypothetical protein K2Z90_008045 [Rhodococcus opacus PD630]
MVEESRPSTTKARFERAILHSVYDEDRFAEIRHRDRPDFAIHFPVDDPKGFGVEITEIYQSGSDARLLNIQNYFSELIEGRRHRHRDDIEELKVDKVTVTNKDGVVTHEELTAIIRNAGHLPRIDEVLAGCISAKSHRLPDYIQEFRHVNLIVCDRVENGPAVGEVYPASRFLSRMVKAAMNDSGFYEVFLVSTDRSGGQVVRPLRQLALAEAGYMFAGALDAHRELFDSMTEAEFYSVFIASARTAGLELQYVDNGTDDGRCAVYGGVGIQFRDTGITILDYADHVPPPTCDPSSTVPADTMSRILSIHESFIEGRSFTSPLGQPAVKNFRETFANEQ